MTCHVVFASPTGGVGRTTLVAHVTARLAAAGKRCLAVDLDPQNALALYLGGNPSQWVQANRGASAAFSGAHSEAVGIVQPDLTALALAEHLRMQRAQVAHVPFGVHDAAQRRRVERELTADSRALRHRLAQLSPPRCDFVLIDTPAGCNAWAEAALDLADVVLVPVLAQPACLAAIPAHRAYLRECAPAVFPDQTHYVVNRWDPTRQLACDAFDVLTGSLPDRVCSHAVHEDEQLREQLARGAPLLLDNGSQIEADLSALTAFVVQVASGKPRSTTIAAQAS